MNIVRHNAVACTGPALRAQREYVVHKSNWTMIDDVTFLPLSLSLSSLPSLFVISSLFLSRYSSLSATSRGSNPPQAEHRTEDAQSSWFSLFLSLFSFLSLSFSAGSVRSSLLLYHYIYIFLSISRHHLSRSATSRNTSFVPIFVLILPPRRGDTLLRDPRNRKMFRSPGLYRCKWSRARDNRPPYITASEPGDSTNRYIAVGI